MSAFNEHRMVLRSPLPSLVQQKSVKSGWGENPIHDAHKMASKFIEQAEKRGTGTLRFLQRAGKRGEIYCFTAVEIQSSGLHVCLTSK